MDIENLSTLQIIVYIGVCLGSVLFGAVSARKLPLFRSETSPGLNGIKNTIEEIKKNPVLKLKVSEKTSGTFHISEESLQKIRKLEDEYLKEDVHKTLCKLATAEMKFYISEQFKAHTDTIIQAINGKKS